MSDEQLQSTLSRIESKVDRLDEAMRGENGVNVRLAKIEQSESKRDKWLGIIGTASAAAIMAWLWSVLTGKG